MVNDNYMYYNISPKEKSLIFLVSCILESKFASLEHNCHIFGTQPSLVIERTKQSTAPADKNSIRHMDFFVKNYEMYNWSERKQVFASNSKFQIKIIRNEVTYGK